MTFLVKVRARAALHLTVGGLALSFAAQALAQSPTTPPQQSPTEQRAVRDDNGLEEIVVTAQRREENLQDVPISITALSATTLQRSGIDSTLAISQAVPSVKITRSGPAAIFFIRGVGNTASNIGEEGANAIYVDGVYISDLPSMNTEFNDIERVEVLKGPQGTLFGRNSSGGLLNIITRQPGDNFTLNANVGYANYDTKQGQLYLSTPISENAGIDLALTGRDQNDGWGKNKFDGSDYGLGWMWGARSKLLFRPGDATKIILAGEIKRSRDSFASGFNLFRGSIGTGGATFEGDYNVNTPRPGYAATRSWAGSLTIEQNLDWAKLTSITAYRRVRTASFLDADYVPSQLTYADVQSKTRTLQQELRLASTTTTPLSWQIGGFYYRAKVDLLGQTVTGTAVGGLDRGFTIIAGMDTDSLAAFGELSYDLTPTTHVTGGLRFTHEKRSYDGREVPVNQPAGSALETAFTIPLKTDEVTFNKLTYRIALRQDLSDAVNVYASYNRGFKSGIYALNSTPGTNPAVKPQTIDAFEAGLKSELLDGKLRFNAAAFHYSIRNYQIRSLAVAGGATGLLLNAASVKVDGAEAEFELAPAAGLRLFGNVTYLDARFRRFPNSGYYFPNPAVCRPGAQPPGESTGAPNGGNRQCFGPADGNRTPLSPRWSLSLGASYGFDVGDQGRITLNALFSHTSTVFFESDNLLRQPPYSLLNASIEYRPVPRWAVEAFGNNITDRHYYLSGVAGGTGAHGELAAPRTYGVRVRFDY